jgi:hypothetical protein
MSPSSIAPSAPRAALARPRARKESRAAARASRARVRASSDDRDSIEALEARLKPKRANAKTTADARDARARGANPAFGYLDTAAKKNRVRAGANGQYAMWEADPAAWEETPAGERAWTVWTGEKGWMYWMNQASLYGAGGLAFFWVVFRFIGPAIGLYTLN